VGQFESGSAVYLADPCPGASSFPKQLSTVSDERLDARRRPATDARLFGAADGVDQNVQKTSGRVPIGRSVMGVELGDRQRAYACVGEELVQNFATGRE
jgi:hypothetical protein